MSPIILFKLPFLVASVLLFDPSSVENLDHPQELLTNYFQWRSPQIKKNNIDKGRRGGGGRVDGVLDPVIFF